jgi:hypothetical protein
VSELLERERYELTKTKAREWGLCGPAGCPERAEWENAFLAKRLIHAALGERLIYNQVLLRRKPWKKTYDRENVSQRRERNKGIQKSLSFWAPYVLEKQSSYEPP